MSIVAVGALPPPPAGYDSGTYGDGPYGVTTLPSTDESGFLLAEDNALHTGLQGLFVTDQSSNARKVGVWFGQPDPEIRSQAYPYITIDLLDIVENKEQMHSTYGPLDDPKWDYLSNRPPYDPQFYGATGYLLSPVLLVYQITTWSRQPRHDRSIIAQLTNGILHPHFGQVYVPTDGTNRRIVISNFAKRDTTDSNAKRLFRNIWTIQMPSEIFLGALDLTARAQAVIINSTGIVPSPPADLASPILYPR